MKPPHVTHCPGEDWAHWIVIALLAHVLRGTQGTQDHAPALLLLLLLLL